MEELCFKTKSKREEMAVEYISMGFGCSNSQFVFAVQEVLQDASFRVHRSPQVSRAFFLALIDSDIY